MSGEGSRLLGRWGEALAADYLRKKGMEILAAGWRCRFGEIDLIARDGGYLAFVEVKLRKNARYGQAGEAVDRRKRARIQATAELYLAQTPTGLQPRFDVVEIYAPQGMQTRAPEIRHYVSAFEG